MVLRLLLAGAMALTGGAAAPPPPPAADCDGARCWTLRVPADWDRPAAGTIGLRVAVRPATDRAHRIGALFINPGGPGGGAADIAARPDWAAFYLPPQLLERFDLVGIDPRGIDRGCAEPAHDPAVTRFPETIAQAARLGRANAAFARSCTSLPLDTVSVARDFDAVRAALGEARISFLGVSYGTMIAQAYAERFPGRVRAMVLDGVVDRSRPAPRLVLDGAAAVQDGVERLAARAPGSLPLLRQAGAKVAAGQVLLDGRPMTPGELRLSVNDALNTPYADQLLLDGLRSAVDGDGTKLLALSRYTTAEYAPYRAIICADVPHLPPAALPALARAAAATGPALSGASEFWDIESGCAGWPRPARWRPHPWQVPATVRPLILSGAHDVATPRVWAESVHRQIAGSSLLRWDGDGHAAFPVGNSCAARAAAAYLVQPDQPAPASCPADA